jgi:hypothetical protein
MAAQDQILFDQIQRLVRSREVLRGQFFSIGGLLARHRAADGTLAPWLLSAAALIALASWDPLMNGGRFDLILCGLAAYELLIGLTRAEQPQAAVVADRVRRD